MRTYSAGWEAPTSSALARLIIESPRFHASSFDTEKNAIMTEVMDELQAFAEVAVPCWKAQEKYSKITNLCVKEDGYVQMTAALRYFERRQSVKEKRMFAAEDALETALLLQITDCILEALDLLHITDMGIKAEICRVVIQGGIPLDGEGFMEGEGLEGPPIEEAEETQAQQEAA